LIAEVVLKYFDERHNTRHDVRYLRYVDDIRLFAKKEIHLRHSLVALDRLSKDVGLFPQSGKIDIHEVVDIEKELKSISNPIEPTLTSSPIDQKELRKRLAELTPGRRGYKVTDPTRFKYLVAHALPSSKLADRLWRVYERAPHYYPQVASHLNKFNQLPVRHARRLIKEVDKQELYPAIRAALIEATVGKFPTGVVALGRKNFKAMWKPSQNQADLTDALWQWLLAEKHFTPAQTRYALLNTESVWLRTKLHYAVPWADLLPIQKNSLLNQSMRSQSADVAITSAWICGLVRTKVEKPLSSINPHAKIVLKEMGVIRRARTAVCGVRLGITEMTGYDIPVDWKKFFGKEYRQAEAQLVTCKGYFKTSASAWVNATDGFVDWLLNALYRQDPALGTYNLGGVGSVLKSTRLIADRKSTRLNSSHDQISYAILFLKKKK